MKKKRQPAKLDRCVKAVKKKGGAANAYAVCKSALKKKNAGKKKSRKGKKNPADAALQGYKEFHGKEADELVTVTKQVHFHKHLSGAGLLEFLKVKTVDGRAFVTLQDFKGALLAFNEKKNQLFIEGGDQKVDLKQFGITSPHEVETLGKAVSIGYFTTKKHLGSDGGTAVYDHKFRMTNDNGKHVTVRIAKYPDVIYRVLDQQIEFSGGSYVIRAEGIDK